MNTEEFIKKSKEIHGDKYDYSETEFVNSSTKVKIICPTHGEFWQNPYGHIHGKGCYKCGREATAIINSKKFADTSEEFIEKAKKVHGDKYLYNKVEYVNAHNKVCITCQKHGDFYQTPNSHLQGNGCPDCSLEQASIRNKFSLDKFIDRAREVHGDKYDYSKVNYINSWSKVKLVCPTHGEFEQIANSHLQGHGCLLCSIKKSSERFEEGKLTTEKFIEKAKKVHGDKYDYSEVDYEQCDKHVKIICKTHGIFQQWPATHLQGHGCPMCSESTLENEVMNILLKNNIVYDAQKTFDWLKYKLNQRLDFWLPDYNIAIECQGEQHFKSVNYFGGEQGFINSRARDENKLKLCSEHGIRILYYSNLGEDYQYPYPVITNAQSLIDEIKKIDLTNLSDNEKI